MPTVEETYLRLIRQQALACRECGDYWCFAMEHGPLNSAAAGYRALHEAAAWLDLSDRGRIRATGPDAARLLHAMTTNHVQQLQAGEGCYAFFLNAQGRILADANLLCCDGSFLIDTEPEQRVHLYEHLDRYIIADDVTLEDESDSTATIAIEGPQAAEVLQQLGAPLPAQQFGWMAWKDRMVARLDTTGAGGFFLIVPAGDKPQLVTELAALGIPEAHAEEARIVRIEHARPRYGEEITDRNLIQETGQLQAVHFTKGCYIGQEIVERVRSRGQVHRQLRSVEVNTDEAPQPGTHLTAADESLAAADRDAGEIVSAAYSPAIQKVVALAYLKTRLADPGTELKLGDFAARVRD